MLAVSSSTVHPSPTQVCTDGGGGLFFHRPSFPQVCTDGVGGLFFHHTDTDISQWEQPEELNSVLGTWELIPATSEHPEFWRNGMLDLSSWKDPRGVTNIFRAALDGRVEHYEEDGV